MHVLDAVFCVETVACCWQHLLVVRSGQRRSRYDTTALLLGTGRAAYDRVSLIRARVSNGDSILVPQSFPLPGECAKKNLHPLRVSFSDVVVPTLEFRDVRRMFARRRGGAADSGDFFFPVFLVDLTCRFVSTRLFRKRFGAI